MMSRIEMAGCGYIKRAVYNIDATKAALFDSGFEEMAKDIRGSQEEFYILSDSRITGALA
jgi:hypothetical protein